MKKSETKTIILQKAGKLLSQKGYFGVSMQDIANEVGITKAALYYHFDSKDALVEILLRDAVSELKSELKHAVKASVLPSDVVFNVIKTFLSFKLKHPEISLLVSLGVQSDENIPVLEMATELRQELIKSILLMVKGLDLARVVTYTVLSNLITSIISITLSPFYPVHEKGSRQTAKDLTDLLTQKV